MVSHARSRRTRGRMLVWNGARTIATEFATRRDSTGRDQPGLKNISGPRKLRRSATFRDRAGCAGTAATEFQDRCLKPLGHPSEIGVGVGRKRVAIAED